MFHSGKISQEHPTEVTEQEALGIGRFWGIRHGPEVGLALEGKCTYSTVWATKKFPSKLSAFWILFREDMTNLRSSLQIRKLLTAKTSDSDSQQGKKKGRL